MIFQETDIKGVFIIELDRNEDDRGFFARAFCSREFEEHGLSPHVAQANLSYSRRKGTLRGMHYRVEPSRLSKFVRCVGGAVWDVVVDLRPGSPTFRKHVGVELSADNRRAISIPPMVAHGFQSLTDGAELLYLVDEPYAPACERGIRHDDPAVGIEWPLPVTEINERDRTWPLLS